MTDPQVSVVVITKNEEEVIESCLASIFSQSIKPAEVIVADGRSTDHTLEKAQKFPVKILVESGRTSPSNARNLGVRNAASDIVLVMGADTELANDCIKNALRYFDKPQVVCVIPSLEIRVHTRIEKVQEKWFYGTRSRFRTMHGTGSSIQFIRKDAYLSVEFDPKLGYGDDSDFRRRLQKAYPGSERIVRVPDSKILVDLPHSLSEISSQYAWYGRTWPRYFARYHSVGSILRLGSVLMPFLLLVSLVLAVVYSPILYLTIFILVLLLVRNIVVCIRSRSAYFLEFVVFDFVRSVFWIYGLAQGFSSRRTGR